MNMISVNYVKGGNEVTTTKDPKKKFRKELNSGTTSLILLSVLAQADEPMYGYQIAKLITQKSSDAPVMKQGALYPVLRALASAEFLDSHVNPSVSGPPRRYYKITESGRETLQEWEQIWKETSSFIDNILGGNHVG